jgi:hypothetical protein
MNSERKASNQIRNSEGVGWVIQTTIMRSRKNFVGVRALRVIGSKSVVSPQNHAVY